MILKRYHLHSLCVILSSFAMPPRKRAKTSSTSQGPSSRDINTGQLLGTSVSKSALVQIIQSLYDSGHMKVRLTRQAIRKRIESHANFQTPHGTVVQRMSVGPHSLEYIHPAALLFYLCTISPCFVAAMEYARATASNGVCQVVLYSDAATPGNVFRPDKGRKLEAFYWYALALYWRLDKCQIACEDSTMKDSTMKDSATTGERQERMEQYSEEHRWIV